MKKSTLLVTVLTLLVFSASLFAVNTQATADDPVQSSQLSEAKRVPQSAIDAYQGTQGQFKVSAAQDIFFEDFEGDVMWTKDAGYDSTGGNPNVTLAAPSKWMISEDKSYSPTHALFITDDENVSRDFVFSPEFEIPEMLDGNPVVSAKLSFQVNIDNPGWGVPNTNNLADYFMVYAAYEETTFMVDEGVGADGSDAYYSGYPEANSFQYLASPEIDLSAAGDTIALNFDFLMNNEENWDLGRVDILTADGPVMVAQLDFQDTWMSKSVDISAFQGQTVQVRFAFLPDDGTMIEGGGLWLDNIAVEDNATGVLFTDNADDAQAMTASGVTLSRLFYDYDRVEDGGADWWLWDESVIFNGTTDLVDLGFVGGDKVHIVFRYITDGKTEQGELESAGMFIDDVAVTAISGIPTDAGVTGIIPAYPMTAGQPSMAAAVVKNFGFEAQTAIGLWYQIDENTAMPVPPYLALPAFADTTKTFAFTYPEAPTSMVKAYTLLTDDGNAENDAAMLEMELEAPGSATFTNTTGDLVYFSTTQRASVVDPMGTLQNTDYYNLESLDLLMYDLGGVGETGIEITVATVNMENPLTPDSVLYQGALNVPAGGVQLVSVPVGAEMLTAPVMALLDYTNSAGNTGLLIDDGAPWDMMDFLFFDPDEDGTSDWYFSSNGHNIYFNTTYPLPPTYITSYMDDFEDGEIWEGWDTNARSHTLTEEDGVLKIAVDKPSDAEKWDGLTMGFGDNVLLDLSENGGLFSVDLLATGDCTVDIAVWDVNGEYNPGNNQINLVGGDDWTTMTFEFTGDNLIHYKWNGDSLGTVDAANIHHLLMTFNGGNPWTGQVWMDNLKLGEAAIPPKQNKPILPIHMAKGPIAIDGVLDPVFAHTDWYRDYNVIAASSSEVNPEFNEAALGWRALYDDNFLYFFVNVTDDSLMNDSADFYRDDGVEFYIDGDNSKNEIDPNNEWTPAYDDNDITFNVTFVSEDDPLLFACSNPAVKYAGTLIDGGFFVEVAVPWNLIGGKKMAGAHLGLEVDFNDDDDGDDRDSKLKYFSVLDDSWRDPSTFGTVVLTDKEITPYAPIHYVDTPLTIDGEKDDVLADEMMPMFHVNHLFNRTDSLASIEDLYYQFNVVWDSTHVYYFVELWDDALVQNGELNYQDDGFELWFDPDNSKATSYDGVNDFGIAFKYVPGAPIDSVSIWPGTDIYSTDMINYAAVQTDKGLNLEFALPLDSLGIDPVNGWKFGFELDWNDDDNDGGRDTKCKFFTGIDDTWQNPSLLNTGVFVGGPGEPMVDEDEMLLAIDKTAIAPIIDGKWDSTWDNSRNYKIEKLATHDTTASDWWDTYGNFRFLYDDDFMYLFVGINDDSIYTDNATSYENDNIEIYWDGNNSKNPLDAEDPWAWPPTSYDEDDDQWRFVYGKDIEGVHGKVDVSGVDYAYSESDSGWAVEMAIPLDGQPINAKAGEKLGFEISVGDNDGEGRERILKWWATNDNAWNAPEEFGTAIFTAREINEEALGRVLPVEFTTFPIAVDAEMDHAWTQMAPMFGNYRWKEADSLHTPGDAELCWRATWDYSNLYLWVRVMDDVLLNEGGTSGWQEDSIELWLDGDGDQSVNWNGGNEYFFSTLFSEETVLTPFAQGKGAELDSTDMARIQQAQKLIPGGFIMEAAFPLDLLGIEPGDGSLFALEVDYNDSDTPGLDRDTKVKTFDPTDGTWGDSRKMGLARLVGGAIESSVESEAVVVTQYELRQNYPNPFNPSTTIEFSLPVASMAKLTVYDILGRQVVELVNQRLESGRHTVTFDASKLASGVYFYRLQTPGKVMHKKMMLIK